jgi:hypothetical protein
MACEQDLVDLQKRLSKLCDVEERDDDVIIINGDNLHLPPMHFPHDILAIAHLPTNTQFTYKAQDSIACWALQHTTPETLQVLEVPYAKNWSNASRVNATAVSASGLNFTSTEEGDASGDGSLKQHKWDWTYSSDYNCTVKYSCVEEEFIVRNGNMVSAVSGKCIPTSTTTSEDTSPDISHNIPGKCWIPCSAGGIDMNMLRAKDDILFYDELLLYQVFVHIIKTSTSIMIPNQHF